MHDLWEVETIIITWNYEKFKDTKGLIISRKSKKDGQYNDQKKKDKRTNNDLQNTTHKKIEQHDCH
jgi:hypothetical protein